MTSITNGTHSRTQRRVKILRGDPRAHGTTRLRHQSSSEVHATVEKPRTPAELSTNALSWVADTRDSHSIAAGTYTAYSSDQQIACCHSLIRVGFGEISLQQIEKYVLSACNWLAHSQAFHQDPECQFFFPNNTLTMDSISELARFHDGAILPPSPLLDIENLPEARSSLASAKRTSREITTRLSMHQYWIDIESLVSDENALTHLNTLLRPNSISEFQAVVDNWLASRLAPNTTIETHIACGNLTKLASAIKLATQFSESESYRRILGPQFLGIKSDWQHIQLSANFFALVSKALSPGRQSQEVVCNWTRHEDKFYSLCRKASIVRRRLHKLNRLVKRQYFTPREPEAYHMLAHKSISRLDAWHSVLNTCPGRENDSPQQIVRKFMAPNFKILRRSTIN